MSPTFRKLFASDLAVLILLGLVRLVLHTLTNHQYGFHRDELAMLEDARHLALGYVAYPPVTAWIVRGAFELFGPALAGLRFFSALAMSAAMVLAGLMAKELGGSRRAQVVTAIAVALAPIALIQGALFQYVSFDYLWWVLVGYFTLRLLKSEDPRWWLAIGAGIGVGMMTKYTMVYLAAGVVGGVLLTRARRYLISPWLWGGAALSVLIFVPNILWQVQHDFISLEFLRTIHARDVAIGRTEGFLIEQLFVAANLFTLPLWAAGLYFYFVNPAGRAFRLLGWMYIIPFVLFLVTQGRSYYLAPAYPVLVAAGSTMWEAWLAARPARQGRLGWGLIWSGLVLGGVLFIPVMTPVAPVNSAVWELSSEIHDNFVEQIGWPELVETVAGIYANLPADEQAHTGILAGNYGEAGAVNLYGPAYGLPPAISGINSFWLRGFGDPPPENLIVVGFTGQTADRFFEDCKLAGRVTNQFEVENEETRFHPDIFLCREPRVPWPELWPDLQSFG
jgi:4-amino-4-deoxy-L-arabinose transferase-like glycosyltransferase